MHRNTLINTQHPRFSDLAVDGPTDFPINTRLAASNSS